LLASAASERFSRSRCHSWGLAASRFSMLPIKLVVVSLPATRSKMQNPKQFVLLESLSVHVIAQHPTHLFVASSQLYASSSVPSGKTTGFRAISGDRLRQAEYTEYGFSQVAGR
jgi:hypothetical protein